MLVTLNRILEKNDSLAQIIRARAGSNKFQLPKFKKRKQMLPLQKRPTASSPAHRILHRGALQFCRMFWSRAAQALAPRVEYCALEFIWNLVPVIWNFTIRLVKEKNSVR